MSHTFPEQTLCDMETEIATNLTKRPRMRHEKFQGVAHTGDWQDSGDPQKEVSIRLKFVEKLPIAHSLYGERYSW